MNKDFDTEIIGISERIKGGYSYLISNFSKIVAVVTAAIATMLVFTDITFLGINSRELTTSLALILVSSYLMYFSLEEAGEKLYEESEDFKNLMAEYFIELEKIGLEKLGSLREYCEKYADEELTYRRRQALLAAGLSAEEYDTFVKNEGIGKNAFSSDLGKKNRKKIRALSKISKMKRIKLSPEMLLSLNSCQNERIKDPGRGKLFMLGLKILPSTVCMFFTASVVLTAKELSFVSVMEGIIKLSALPIVGFRGYINGYNYKKDSEASWIKTKIKLLRGFILADEKKA
jgi:hypothetical protein